MFKFLIREVKSSELYYEIKLNKIQYDIKAINVQLRFNAFLYKSVFDGQFFIQISASRQNPETAVQWIYSKKVSIPLTVARNEETAGGKHKFGRIKGPTKW